MDLDTQYNYVIRQMKPFKTKKVVTVSGAVATTKASLSVNMECEDHDHV